MNNKQIETLYTTKYIIIQMREIIHKKKNKKNKIQINRSTNRSFIFFNAEKKTHSYIIKAH